jgi:hypothetical protein
MKIHEEGLRHLFEVMPHCRHRDRHTMGPTASLMQRVAAVAMMELTNLGNGYVGSQEAIDDDGRHRPLGQSVEAHRVEGIQRQSPGKA